MITTTDMAYSILLPAFAELDVDRSIRGLFEKGCRALLFGESREEYVARRMSPERISVESADALRKHILGIRAGYGSCLVAVDDELGGIQRLSHLIGPLPSVAEAYTMDGHALETICRIHAEKVRNIGINMSLAPILDILTGDNPWLADRTVGKQVDMVTKIAVAYVRGVQDSGIIATPKHYPGYPHVTGDPAVQPAVSEASFEEVAPILRVFDAVCRSGAKAIMLGPAIARAVDVEHPASLSAITVEKLERDTGFRGLVVSDDLDAQGILLGRPLEQAAVESLCAGADLLLVAAGDHLHGVVDAIVRAVGNGKLPEERLAEASMKVRHLAVENE